MGLVLPAALSVGYVVNLLAFYAPGGGFGNFAEVTELRDLQLQQE